MLKSGANKARRPKSIAAMDVVEFVNQPNDKKYFRWLDAHQQMDW